MWSATFFSFSSTFFFYFAKKRKRLVPAMYPFEKQLYAKTKITSRLIEVELPLTIRLGGKELILFPSP